MAAKPKSHSHLSSGAGFIQTKRKYLRHMIELVRPMPAPMLWFWLEIRCDRLNRAHMDERLMVADLGLSRSSLYKGMAELEERNMVWRDGTGVVHLNHDLTWHGFKSPSAFMSRCFGAPIDIAKPTKGKRKVAAA